MIHDHLIVIVQQGFRLDHDLTDTVIDFDLPFQDMHFDYELAAKIC